MSTMMVISPSSSIVFCFLELYRSLPPSIPLEMLHMGLVVYTSTLAIIVTIATTCHCCSTLAVCSPVVGICTCRAAMLTWLLVNC